MKKDAPSLLAAYSLRNTQPRTLVLSALLESKKPLSHKDIHARITKSGGSISLVTVYRILEAFEDKGLVHKHISSGGFVVCDSSKKHTHHILLSCEDCGAVEECSDAELEKIEDRIAKSKGFSPKTHISELIGVCSSCS